MASCESCGVGYGKCCRDSENQTKRPCKGRKQVRFIGPLEKGRYVCKSCRHFMFEQEGDYCEKCLDKHNRGIRDIGLKKKTVGIIKKFCLYCSKETKQNKQFCNGDCELSLKILIKKSPVDGVPCDRCGVRNVDNGCRRHCFLGRRKEEKYSGES